MKIAVILNGKFSSENGNRLVVESFFNPSSNVYISSYYSFKVASVDSNRNSKVKKNYLK